MRGVTWLAVGAFVAAAFIAPAATAHHCDTKINVYGRVGFAPFAPPPYARATAGTCVRIFNDAVVDSHSLPPNTDQVFVRVNGDFGPSITSVRATLDGLGFLSNDVMLHRTSNALGGFTYNAADWLALPDGAVDGVLNVTAHYPGGPMRVSYHTTATILPPPVPPIPSAPTPPTVPTLPPAP